MRKDMKTVVSDEATTGTSVAVEQDTNRSATSDVPGVAYNVRKNKWQTPDGCLFTTLDKAFKYLESDTYKQKKV
jgi:hypothetical protein